jgi:hypothetical protein
MIASFWLSLVSSNAAHDVSPCATDTVNPVHYLDELASNDHPAVYDQTLLPLEMKCGASQRAPRYR